MSYIRNFRINRDRNSTTEFYIKYEYSDGKILGNFRITDGGVYYYRAKSQILSPKENNNTRNTWDGFIAIEKLGELFELLKKAHLNDLSIDELSISRSRGKVIIESQKVKA